MVRERLLEHARADQGHRGRRVRVPTVLPDAEATYRSSPVRALVSSDRCLHAIHLRARRGAVLGCRLLQTGLLRTLRGFGDGSVAHRACIHHALLLGLAGDCVEHAV